MPQPEPSYPPGSIVSELTRGQPYIFMVMPFNEDYPLFRLIRDVVQQSVGLACIRADEVKGSGHDLLAKIHVLIERSELVIADIAGERPNVFYEIGYALGVKKELMLVVKAGTNIPTDLKGREVIQYVESKDGMQLFERELREHLRLRINSQTALLRDMLEADKPQPAYIVASPKHPKQRTQDPVFVGLYDPRTFGDYLGIRGLITAFGLTMGEGASVELISEQVAPPDFLARDLNLYFIGSDKNNPAVKDMLERMQKGQEPAWEFGPYPGETAKGDYRNALYRTKHGERELKEGESELVGRKRVRLYTKDYGIIVRGPHPDHSDRLLMVMAGPHSLGTGAACLAATRSPLIQEIKARLAAIDVKLTDRDQAFWVLVSGRLKRQENIIEMGDVTIEEVGIYG